MTTAQRWAAIATAIGALAVTLPAAAQADSSPTTTMPGVPPVAICSTPTPSPGTGDGSSTGGTSTSGGTSSGGSSSSPGPGTDQTTVEPVPCVDASGNVYIFYVITTTTTTTTTPISAPIITANGPITWVSGNPVNETGGATTTTLADPFAAIGAFSCMPIAGTSSMVCSLEASGSTSTTATSGGKLKLKCTLSEAALKKTTASKGKAKPGTKTKKGTKAKTDPKSNPNTKAKTKTAIKNTTKSKAKPKAKRTLTMVCRTV